MQNSSPCHAETLQGFNGVFLLKTQSPEQQEGRVYRPSHLSAPSHPSAQGVFKKYRSKDDTRGACSVRCFLLLKSLTSSGCYSAPDDSLLCCLLRLDMSHSLLQLFSQQVHIQQLCSRKLRRGLHELQVTNDKTIGSSICFTLSISMTAPGQILEYESALVEFKKQL